MNEQDSFTYLILFVKIIFIFLAVAHIYLKIIGKDHSDIDNIIVYWKNRGEFLFVALMSFLLIYLFNPRKPTPVIDYETKQLLFLFGFMLLVTANWSLFIHESKWFKRIQQTIGRE